jgi:hypothetical protein
MIDNLKVGDVVSKHYINQLIHYYGPNHISFYIHNRNVIASFKDVEFERPIKNIDQYTCTKINKNDEYRNPRTHKRKF